MMVSKLSPLIVGDRAMLNDKIVVAYHKRNDMDFLGTVQLTNTMKKMIVSIENSEYNLNKFDNIVVSYYKFIDGSMARVVGNFSERQAEIFGKLKMPFPYSYVNKFA